MTYQPKTGATCSCSKGVLECGHRTGLIRDYNGNTVGEWSIE